MKRLLLCLTALLLLGIPALAGNLQDARQGFTTTLTQKISEGNPPPIPPPDIFQLVTYPSPIGDMAAYVSPSPKDGQRHPAIIWVVGGMSNGIGGTLWDPRAKPENDQTASAYRKAGIIMMCPSRRGGNTNPGYHEGFYGEVDDIIAARHYLEKLDYVDPARIYLGGHSTGGTLALLVAECGGGFRSVFSFGPVDQVSNYGPGLDPYDLTNQKENDLRSPVKWLQAITSPVFIFEGMVEPSNIDALHILQNASTNPLVHFYPLQGKSHFSELGPTNKVIAAKILADDGPASTITFTDAELCNAAAN